MNILYLAGESANFVIALCNEFCNQGHTVTCVAQTADEYDKENRIPSHENLDLRFKKLPFDNIDSLAPELIFELQDKKFDIVFGSHTPISPLVKRLGEMMRVPWGIMLLDIPSDLMEQDVLRMRNWLYFFDILKFAPTLIFNTETARDEYFKFTKQFFPDKHVVPYATHMPEKFDMAGKDIKGDYVVSVCRLTPVKNCNLIPRALSLLDRKLGYVAIGRDRGDLSVIKDICEKNNIEFKHFEDVSEEEKFELIKNSSMLIYPQNTAYIGGLSPFEGMYAGKPVLTLDFKVLQDLYKNNVFYTKNDALEMAESIAFINSLNPKLKADIVEKANQYAKKTASFENMAGGMLKIFKEVTGK